MSIGFKRIDDSIVIYKKGCGYYQSQAYTRKEFVYVKVGSSYLKISSNNGTTSASVSIDDIDLAEIKTKNGKMGWLNVSE